MLDKSADRVRRMFNSIAPRYDFLNSVLSLGIDRYWRYFTAKKIVQRLRPVVNGAILDVCCGTGDLTLVLHRLAKFKVNAVDFSEAMVERAKKKTAAFPNISITVGDALCLPFESNQFAAVANAFGLRNVGSTQNGLAEMIRVCRPGGTVAVLDFSMPTLPVLKQLYRFYFRTILPKIGNYIAKNKDTAYQYLPDSVLAFDTPQQLAERMTQLGLKDTRIHLLTCGIAVLVLGNKPV